MKRSIGHKLVISIFLFSSLVTVFTTALQIYLDYSVDLKRIHNYETLITETYLKSLATSVWAYDDKQINTQINGILNLPDIEHLEIHTGEGAKWSVGSINSTKNLTTEFPLLYKHKGEDITIGVLRVVVGFDNIYTNLFKKAITILISNAITIFLVSGFTLVIFQYLLTRHLSALASWLRNLDIGKSFDKFHLKRPPRKSKNTDELDEVVQAFNKMANSIQQKTMELQASEEKFRDLSESLPQSVFELDLQGNLLYSNQKGFESTGYSSEDLNKGIKAAQFVIPEERAKLLGSMQRMIEERLDSSNEYTMLKKDGSTFYAIIYSRPIIKEKSVVGFRGVVADITARKKAEKKLKENETLMTIVLDTLPIGVWFTDKNGKIEYGNHAAQEIWQGASYVKPDHFHVYKGWWYDTGKAIAPEEWAVARALNNKEESHAEMIEIECFNGDHKIIQNWAVPILDSDGNVERAIAINRDITKSIAIKDEKEKLEEQLRQSHKMEAVGTMAGGIAHDFNNLLTIITGNAEMALDDISADNPAGVSIEEILQASRRASDLVKQILTFSRKEKKELIPIHTQSLIKETLKLLRSTTPTTVSIFQDISKDCGKIMSDPTGLHQVLMNLFTNGVHAMDEKGEITVSLQEVDLKGDDFARLTYTMPYLFNSPGKYARLTVTDTGTGMDKETVKRIFDPFYTTKDVGKGTGMGLSVVHGIVESHDGFIAVDSEPGWGSTISIYIPITEEVEEEYPGEETVASPVTGTERILLVDDEEALLVLAKRILDKLGYEVFSEISSSKALERFKADPDKFDLIITDQAMPSMSGSELVAEIVKVRPDMPVILCTGFSTKISEENAREKNISKFISKPYSKKIMAEAVREVLDGKV